MTLPTTTQDRDRTILRYELVTIAGGVVHTFPVPPSGQLVLGRAPDADVRLDATNISRVHAILRATDGAFTIEDRGSSNGCLIRGNRLDPNVPTPIGPGDAVHLGDFIVVVRAVYVEEASPKPSPADGGPIVLAPVMLQLYALTDPIAKSHLSVLILGETGVGKDVFARSIHDRSQRTGPFVRLSCATLSESLLESELFGHARGAFTGAVADKAGLFEAADGGTAFLDEIGEVSPAIQLRLLQVLENREVQRIGSVKPRSIDVRFIAATNRKLEADVTTGRFRSDLYYRLAGFTLQIPPLRDRREEIVPLAEAIVRRYARQMKIAVPAIERDAAAAILAHDWPGNIRELRNAIERAAVLSHGKSITAQHIAPPQLGDAEDPEPELDAPSAIDFSANELAEREALIAALKAVEGNQSDAARTLGISRTRLLNRLDALRIARPRKRPRY